MVNVILADDHKIVRQALRTLLESESDIRVVGEAEDGRQAVQLTERLKPHVVVMDIAMPELSGLEATQQIIRASPGSKVVVLSSYCDDEYVHELLGSGAVGYVVKQAAAQELITAIREAKRGNAYFSPAVTRRLVDRQRRTLANQGVRDFRNRLSSRDLAVIRMVAEGRTSKQIAAAFDLSLKAVESRRGRIMHKLDVQNTAQLTRYAVARKLVVDRENTAVEDAFC